VKYLPKPLWSRDQILADLSGVSAGALRRIWYERVNIPIVPRHGRLERIPTPSWHYAMFKEIGAANCGHLVGQFKAIFKSRKNLEDYEKVLKAVALCQAFQTEEDFKTSPNLPWLLEHGVTTWPTALEVANFSLEAWLKYD
jgi:hypothetical protein